MWWKQIRKEKSRGLIIEIIGGEESQEQEVVVMVVVVVRIGY